MQFISLPSEKKIKHYEWNFKSLLGTGSFGRVYCARDTLHNALVAIKILTLERLSDTFLNQLSNELQLMQQLRDPHIVRLLDMYHSKHNIYLIQELCKNGDLRSILRKSNGVLSEIQALQFLRDIIAGMKALYKENIVHRDLKPENVLQGESGELKIGDFGFARRIQDEGSEMLQSQVGTPLYMSPQVLKSEGYTQKCDVWSTGVMFYEMLYGKTPWIARSQYQLIVNMEKMGLQFPYQIQVSDASKAFIKACLALNEKDRIGWEQIFQHPLITGKEVINQQINQQEQQIMLDNKARLIIQKLQKIIQKNNINLVQLFQNLDKSGDNALDMDEFSNLIKSVDPNVTYEESIHVFQKFDVNGDQQISLEEFQTLVIETDYSNYEVNKDPFLQEKANKVIQELKEKINQSNLNIDQLFIIFNYSNKEELNFAEFVNIINTIDETFSQIEIEYVFRELDEDHGGSISKQELKKALEKKNNAVSPSKAKQLIYQKSQTFGGSQKLDKQTEKIISELKYIIEANQINLKKLFKNFDPTNSGVLNQNAFKKLILIIDETISQEEIDYIYKIFDIDNDGTISFDEFEKYLI